MGISGTFDALILSAGKSSRMGSDKALVRSQEHNLLEGCLFAYNTSGARQITVVVHDDLAKNHAYLNTLSQFPRARTSINKHHLKGRNSSILCGLKSQESYAPLFIQNIDNPPPSFQLMQQMLQSLPATMAVAMPWYKGKSGHPVLLSAALAQALPRLLKGTQPLRDVLRCYPRLLIQASPLHTQFNINTPEALDAYTKIRCQT